MTDRAEKMDHPYIVSKADYCGGSPVIKGTKFPVRSVVNYVLRQGISPEELVGGKSLGARSSNDAKA